MINASMDSFNGTGIQILNIIEEVNHLKDLDTILDKILYEARKLTRADAGTIFLSEEDKLRFSYMHNDTLLNGEESNAAIYSNLIVPINEQSIVGYVAKHREIVSIDDAYNIPENRPYSFDHSFDQKSGYRTTSILTIPLKTFEDKLVGVMQLLNAKNEMGKIVPFFQESRIYIPLFANNASIAVERGVMNREMILRMMRMAELRDPSETGNHVQRVGAYSAEIYQKWAANNKVDKKDIKRTRDLIRLASMLHDVGKVGISDTILKKPAKLTDEEFNIMKWHTVFGSRLFSNTTSDLDKMSCEIALNHHEKWDGSGYPGELHDIILSRHLTGKPKRGREIPIAARITAIADVFDALSSKRSYKEPWPEDKIRLTIEEEAGKHFDPELVEVFFQIYHIIKAIQEKFQ